jgi:hypothetical protein
MCDWQQPHVGAKATDLQDDNPRDSPDISPLTQLQHEHHHLFRQLAA